MEKEVKKPTEENARAREMGRCLKKWEIAVVKFAELGGDGVTTKPGMPTAVTASEEEEPRSETAKKRSREVGDGEHDFNSEFLELRSTRRRVAIEVATESSSPEDGSVTSVVETNPATEPVSCCSSNASTGIVRERSATADPSVTSGETESAQIETLTFSGGRERSEATPSSKSCVEESGGLESTAAAARPMAEAKSRHKSTITEMPSESEIEEFFSAAEKNLQKTFSEKYNFDIEKGVPLEGRYEWIRTNP